MTVFNLQIKKKAKQVIEMGHRVQSEGLDKLKEISNTVDVTNRLADDINKELDEQIEQLDRMFNTVKDTQTVLKRAQVTIRYFTRAVATDKCLMGLICLIFVALLVVVILSIMGKGNFSTPKDV